MKKRKIFYQKNIWLLLLLIMVLANACTCNNKGRQDQGQPADTSTAVENDSALLDSVSLGMPASPEHFDTAAQHWVLSTLHKQRFNTADFQAHNNATSAEKLPKDTAKNVEGLPSGSLGPTGHFDVTKDYTEQFASLLRWSKDSNYIVDLGSYGMVSVKDAKGKFHLEAGEPDTKVVLVNPINHQQTQILFGGPGLRVMDAKWLTDSVFALLYNNTVNQKPDTLLMLTNAYTLESNTYNYQQQK